MDPGEILRGHHISNFEKEITRDNRLKRAVILAWAAWPISVDCVPQENGRKLTLTFLFGTYMADI